LLDYAAAVQKQPESLKDLMTAIQNLRQDVAVLQEQNTILQKQNTSLKDNLPLKREKSTHWRMKMLKKSR
jgi:hypothetical protein